jgi:hypothetical protein
MEGRTAGIKHAVVIGGSMAALLAARVLSDWYEHVTVIDRDAFPMVGGHRRGVPQSVHTHGLLASGHYVMNRLFPSLGDDLLAAGAVAADVRAKLGGIDGSRPASRRLHSCSSI